MDLKLQAKGLESFLPLHTVYRHWSDRWKKVDVPLFSSYVFVRILQRDITYVVKTDGVVRIVSFNGSPTHIPENEINAVRQNFEMYRLL